MLMYNIIRYEEEEEGSLRPGLRKIKSKVAKHTEPQAVPQRSLRYPLRDASKLANLRIAHQGDEDADDERPALKTPSDSNASGDSSTDEHSLPSKKITLKKVVNQKQNHVEKEEEKRLEEENKGEEQEEEESEEGNVETKEEKSGEEPSDVHSSEEEVKTNPAITSEIESDFTSPVKRPLRRSVRLMRKASLSYAPCTFRNTRPRQEHSRRARSRRSEEDDDDDEDEEEEEGPFLEEDTGSGSENLKTSPNNGVS